MIKQYPSHLVDSLWHGSADALVTAMARSGGECTGDQLKMMLMRGEMLLIGSDDVWAAVQHIQHPNKRVLHVYAVACTKDGDGLNHADIAELCEYARQTGCTALTCSADKAAERLYARYGFEPIYTTMGIKL
ncbi:MAG: GNAT family N-acetyltransferase [Chryseobacterium sp.]|nr:MAG: GNAT family N-acetyltransferase [Chryseobacterium sp.]